MNTLNTFTGRISAFLTAAFSLVVVALFASPAAFAQRGLDEGASGTSYIIAFPDTTTNTYDTRFNHQKFADVVKVMLYSGVDTKVTIARTNGVQRTYALRAGVFKIVDMSGADGFPQAIVNVVNEIVDNTFKVESRDPIVVYCYMLTGFGSEAFTPLPVDTWGTDYYASTMPGEIGADLTPGGENTFNRVNKPFPSEILVIAAFDNTHIAIQPNGTLWNYPQTAVTLQAGQAYQVQCTVDTLLAHFGNPEFQSDLGGSHITSDKPVGVISGNTRGQIIQELPGLGLNSFKNMMIEAIAPTEQHGKEFAYMPTWDSRRPLGTPKEQLNGKRTAEFVRVYSTEQPQTNGTVTDGVTGSQTNFTTNYQPRGMAGWFLDDKLGIPLARRYRTEKAAQAYMFSPGVTKNNGTTGGNNFIGASYEAWGGYQVELTPREQWVKFAPYYAPTEPAAMEHFINVVTDTASRFKVYQESGSLFIFNRGVIPGTDLIWGTMTVTPGIDHFLEGRNGAKFAAFAYGIYKGYELYRPGKAKKKDDGTGVASAGTGGKGNPTILHPSEYEENLGLGYGYPLAPSRLILKPADSLEIVTSQNCSCMLIKIRALNQNPVGLRRITLVPSESQNAKMVFLDPDQSDQPGIEIMPTEVIGKSRAMVRVCAINELQDAKGVVEIVDRTGKKWRVPYAYEAERVDVTPPELDFGIVTLNSPKDLTAKISNPLKKDVIVKDLDFLVKDNGFQLIAPNKASLPITLKSGDSMLITVRLIPTENRSYRDTVLVTLGCVKVKIPLKGEPVRPCVYVDDLPFYTLQVNESKTLPLKICNKGTQGVVRFVAPYLTWDPTLFKVDQASIDRLRDAVLGPGECVTIDVTFSSPNIGVFQITARFHTTTDCERDTSIWTANVVQPGPLLTGYDWKQRWVTPKASGNCTKNLVPSYSDTVWATNTGTSDFRVQEIKLIGQDAVDGYFQLGTDPIITVGQVIRPLGSGGQRHPQQVLFFPKDERTYSCQVIMVTESGDTARNILLGEGLESHVTITDKDWGTMEYTNGMQVPDKVTIMSTSKVRDLTVTGLRVIGADFIIDPAFAQPTPGAPWVMRPSETRDIPLLFTPQSPGRKIGVIQVIGDHEVCLSDSVGALAGNSYTQGAVPVGFDFPDLLGGCDQRTGTVSLTSTGTDTVIITGIALVDANGVFRMLNPPAVPRPMTPGEKVEFDVQFTPTVPGNFNGKVVFTVMRKNGQPLGDFDAPLTGKAHVLQASTHIDRNYKRFPGTKIMVPVRFDGPALDEAQINKFYFEINYNKGVLLLTNPNNPSMTQGTMTNGWTMNTTKLQSGLFGVDVTAPPGEFLRGATGTLLNLEFLTFIGDTTCSELPYLITLDAPRPRSCVTIATNPGSACIDSVCGMNFRLIELTTNKYRLDQNRPNPSNGSTEIKFSVGLDGYTALNVYNAQGEKVATLVNSYLKPGVYSVTWDAAQFPAGLYYYRLNSGTWSSTNSMILQK